MQTKDVLVSTREQFNLNNGWRFYGGSIDGVESENFDVSKWDSINLPHTWNNLDGQDGGGDFRRGDSWYRNHFTVDQAYRSKKVYIQFDGVCLVSDIYINGIHIGQHRGAFATFRFDITGYIDFGKDNLIAVKVNNERNNEVAPYQTDNMDMWVDFTLFGGIYRDVSLLVTDKLQINPIFYGSSGVFVNQRHVSPLTANIEITTKVFNNYDVTKDAVLVTGIFDEAGNEVKSVTRSITLAANTGYDFVQSVDIPNPHLWNALKDPYLYRLSVELNDGYSVTDVVTQPLGLRYFHMDANDGFILNGAYYDLHGVARHQDRADKGWAISKEDHIEDFNIIKEMGSTIIRMAHYQHEQSFLDLCDRFGMVVWAEVCLVGHYVNSEAFDNNIREQMKELMYQNINRPSVVCWGLLNEIGENETGSITESLYSLCHRIDPARPTTLAMHGGEPKDWGELSDLEAHNKYFGWYTFYTWTENTTGEFAEWADNRHKSFPGKKFGISEYGAGANIDHHEENPAQPDTEGHWHPEEYQSYYHEEYWKAMKIRPYLWCKIIWNGFDFASDPRNEGARPGINDKGLVTHDRKVRKDAYYYYKANWSEDPFVYITSKRFVERTNQTTHLKVYSNCDTVELKVNGESLGSLTSDDRIFKWDEVKLSEGNSLIEVTGKKGDSKYIDKCEWILIKK